MVDPPQKHIIIIGAGVGGTATAARLGKQGFRVTVLEKNSFSGGRCSLIHHNGHRFDQGPSLYLMPKMFEETFDELGEKLTDHIELLKCQTNYKLHFQDGESILLSPDLAHMKTEIERFEGPGEAPFLKYLGFLAESHVHYEHSMTLALKRNFEAWYEMFQPKFLPELFKLHLFSKIYSRAEKYFSSAKMRMAFTFQTMYMGMSPFDAPGTYNLLQYTELAEGIWYPKGGFHKVVSSLETIANKKFGAQFRYDAPVKQINTAADGKTVTGVTLESGEVIHADAVVCNADLVYAYNKLLPPSNYGKRIGKASFTSSSISLYWGMKRKIPELDVHNIFLADAYKESFDEIFKDHTLPSEPSFYINVPSRIDPTAAPENKDTMVVLVPVGHMTDAHPQDYDSLVAKARSLVLGSLLKHTGVDFAPLIDFEIFNDPRTWQAKFNLWQGSILGLSHNILQVLWFRPSTKDGSGRYDNLFFVGASTHPGTGVPIVLCGARLTSDQVGRHFGVSDEKRGVVKAKGKKVDGAGMIGWFLVLLAVLAVVVGMTGTNGLNNVWEGALKCINTSLLSIIRFQL
ncbi:Phytoene dehydrogenase [Jimgerdemannia flammicorona]|uniref:Phytoene desaturase n=1 Tax=Jimgerdemannia flammicorona TaxID=994334 RepID=A0A433QJX4_9FUNG|nr:Phytoene dehydrogenase [Jimgerdemannia flammicorona]